MRALLAAVGPVLCFSFDFNLHVPILALSTSDCSSRSRSADHDFGEDRYWHWFSWNRTSGSGLPLLSNFVLSLFWTICMFKNLFSLGERKYSQILLGRVDLICMRGYFLLLVVDWLSLGGCAYPWFRL